MSQFKQPALVAAITAASLLLASCEELEGDLPTVEIESNILPGNQEVEAITGAQEGVEDLASGAAAPMANIQSNLESTVTSMESMSILSDLFESDEIDDGAMALARSAKEKIAKSGEEDSMEDIILALFDLQNASADLSTNTITVGANTEAFCYEDDSLDPSEVDTEYNNCMDVIGDVSLTIQVINSEAGVITVNYSDYSPFQISYAPEYLAGLVDLGELKSTIIAVDAATDGEGVEDIPDTFEGQYAVTISALTDQATLVAWVPESISIGDGTSDITLSATDNLATLDLNSAQETVQFTSNVSAINGSFVTEDNETLDISFAGANFDLLIDGAAQTATITNSGTVGNGLTISLDNEQMVSAMLAPFSGAYSDATETLSITSAFDLAVGINGEMEGEQEYDDVAMTYSRTTDDGLISLDVEMPANTALVNSENTEQESITTVESGELSITVAIDVSESCESTWGIDEYEEDATPVCSVGTGPETMIETTFSAGDVIDMEEEDGTQP